MNFEAVVQSAVPLLTSFVLKLVGALALWIIGRWLINLVTRLVVRSLRFTFDQTVAGYIGTAVKVLLNVALVLAILNLFGIETTSFAALLAGVGLAVGAAWSGLLSHLAAGIFILILRPYKIGDLIQAGGTLGVVEEIGLFITTLNTADNVRTMIGNSKVFSDTIQNFSTNPYRRVDLLAQLDNSTDVAAAVRLLRERLATIPNVRTDPRPDVEILQFTPLGPVLAVRPYCAGDHYWQVYFDTNRTIRDTFGAAGFAAPEQRVLVRNAG